MYAVIETGGKQYRVEKGSLIRVERLDVPEGEKVVFEKVLLAGDAGEVLAGKDAEKVRVEGTVVRHGKAGKIIVFKYRPKKGYHRKRGHRQPFTEVRVEKISGGPRGTARKKKAESAPPGAGEEAAGAAEAKAAAGKDLEDKAKEEKTSEGSE